MNTPLEKEGGEAVALESERPGGLTPPCSPESPTGAPSPGEALAQRWRGLMNLSPAEPSAAEIAFAAELIATHGSAADAALFKLVALLKRQFPEIRTFCGSGRYWPEALAAWRREQDAVARKAAAAEKARAEKAAQEAKLAAERRLLDEARPAWDALPCAERETWLAKIPRHAPAEMRVEQALYLFAKSLHEMPLFSSERSTQ